jgi:hypothetical protein
VKTPAKGEPETLFSPTNQHKNWYDFFQRTGIGMAQALSQDTPHTRRAARRVTQRTGWRYVDVRNWFDFYRDVLQFPEEAARLAEVKAVAADRGVKFPERMDVQSMIALMIAGKTVTADFSGGGEWARVINRMVPFFTASIKGPQASLSALQRDPRQVHPKSADDLHAAVALSLVDVQRRGVVAGGGRDREIPVHHD